jgi:hypothetical protein
LEQNILITTDEFASSVNSVDGHLYVVSIIGKQFLFDHNIDFENLSDDSRVFGSQGDHGVSQFAKALLP